MTHAPLTRRNVFAQAWPIMLGQMTVPLVGIVDTVVIGRTGDAAALAGVALGTTIINFLFWSFGFLRMGMTGLTAQAQGAGDDREVRAMLARGLLLAMGVGTVLFALQLVLIPAALALFAGGKALDDAARAYVSARFLGAPAALAVFAVTGWLLGLGRTRAALLLQLVMNCVNAGLDIGFVHGLDMGARGIGLGTACAEWTALATGLGIGRHILGRAAMAGVRAVLFDRAVWRRLIAVNADIMVRTVALLFLFAWFAHAGARLGMVALAANQILMQCVSVAAFVLDGFAFTAESRVGQAVGARDPAAMRRAMRLTGEFTLGAGLCLALATWAWGSAAIDAITPNAAVRAAGQALLPLVALVPLLGAPAWLLDGVFIGATRGRALRNAALAATALYVASDLALRPLGPAGMWVAMLASYLYRAGALTVALPALFGSMRSTALAEPGQHS